ncbi:trypsin-like peptidase domain-containing protein [Oscillibacter sp.]|uniref:S1C family serine protease n=1 Tax=Oscillibacter sp. TaxID=1945593 RepID=UPI0026178E50|nr:trypsin-like peptidase domain-containing protein [Oscillibacter sp.]MDD3346704.1 trypsin-like peptidase domain-containing protein [Oscillibacter sp.]
MYNDEENLYHYTYRKDGSEAGQTDHASVEEQLHQYQSGAHESVQEMKIVKKNRVGMKLTALALSCALVGGAVGGGVVWAVGGGSDGSDTSVNVSNRPVTQVAIKSVDGKSAMTDAEVYASNVNSVVSINVTGTSGTNFFGQAVQTASAGSGFVLTKDGYIVTNYHVVKDADTVKATMYNGDTYDAKFIGGDEDYDIAVIKVDAAELPAVTLGDSDKLNVGDHVLAVGNPLGELTFSMSGGMVSSVNRAINVSGTPFNMIQTDASINPGNSGGPLFNQYGEVMGIVSAKYSSYSSSESVEGLGFAIPINDVVAMIEDIMTNGYVTNKPYLGITGGTMSEAMAAQYRYNVKSGVFVYSVEEGGAAAKAGLKMGDVITKVDDHQIATMEDLTAVKKQYSAGDTATVTIYRENKETTVELTWDAVPANQKSEDETQQQIQQTPDNGQSGGSYGTPFDDLFRYFYGGSYNGSSAKNAA